MFKWVMIMFFGMVVGFGVLLLVKDFLFDYVIDKFLLGVDFCFFIVVIEVVVIYGFILFGVKDVFNLLFVGCIMLCI